MPKISIITRTKNRPLLLTRAIESVDQQTLGDWEHWIVNDGGDRAPVEQLIAARATTARARTRVLHHERSLGMEAASNAALRRAAGEYVVIHDDDDTWHPEFLQRTSAYLDERANNPADAGVITHSERVRERIDGDRVIKIGTSSVNDWIEAITLFRLAANNPFPPISFLYRRAVLDEIGYYREDLPVCGDWEFNLRFVQRYEIGVISEPLARYHQRVQLNDDINSNSVFLDNGVTLRRWEARIRNELLRKDLRDGRIGIGVLVNVSKAIEDIGGPVRLLSQRSETAFNYVKDRVYNFGTKVGLIRNGKAPQ